MSLNPSQLPQIITDFESTNRRHNVALSPCIYYIFLNIYLIALRAFFQDLYLISAKGDMCAF